VCADRDDDKFLACALVAGAPIVVSGDAALLETSGWRGIEVIKPRTFVDRYPSVKHGTSLD
jgi:predicted nucleic acid-binding protein